MARLVEMGKKVSGSEEKRLAEAVETFINENEKAQTPSAFVHVLQDTSKKATFIAFLVEHGILFYDLSQSEKAKLLRLYEIRDTEEGRTQWLSFFGELQTADIADAAQIRQRFENQRNMLQHLKQNGFVPYDYQMDQDELTSILNPYSKKNYNGTVVKVPVNNLLGEAGTKLTTSDFLRDMLKDAEQYFSQRNKVITLLVPVVIAAHVSYFRCKIARDTQKKIHVDFVRVDSSAESDASAIRKPQITTILRNTAKAAFGSETTSTFKEEYTNRQPASDCSSCGLHMLRGVLGLIDLDAKVDDIRQIREMQDNSPEAMAAIRIMVIGELARLENLKPKGQKEPISFNLKDLTVDAASGLVRLKTLTTVQEALLQQNCKAQQAFIAARLQMNAVKKAAPENAAPGSGAGSQPEPVVTVATSDETQHQARQAALIQKLNAYRKAYQARSLVYRFLKLFACCFDPDKNDGRMVFIATLISEINTLTSKSDLDRHLAKLKVQVSEANNPLPKDARLASPSLVKTENLFSTYSPRLFHRKDDDLAKYKTTLRGTVEFIDEAYSPSPWSA